MTLQSKPNTDDVRIREIKELVPPAHVFREFPVGVRAALTTYNARQSIHRILHGADNRLLVVVGPCSIHEVDSAIEYATRLQKEVPRFENDLLIVMRVYFEKPRTTVGWKGLINDPRLDNSFRINEGLRLARGLLLEINDMGLPCATEFLDTITPQYTADLIAWGRSAPARRNRRCIANSPPACRVQSASKTGPTATSASPSTPSAPPSRRITFCR
jgi:3-deoxy-7-phosphoheptulonate synthase